MSCIASFREGVPVVVASGRLDATSAHDFHDALLHAARAADSEIVLDFTGVTALTGAALIAWSNVLPEVLSKSRCKVVGATPQIRRTLWVTAMDQVVAIEMIATDRHAAAEDPCLRPVQEATLADRQGPVSR